MSSPRKPRKKSSAKKRQVSLRLYVAGRLPRSVEAIERLRAICAAAGANAPKVEIVDTMVEPARALADGVVVTPTLLRVSPKPGLLILGALTDSARVRAALDLTDTSSLS